jgi:hypothetical protein
MTFQNVQIFLEFANFYRHFIEAYGLWAHLQAY